MKRKANLRFFMAFLLSAVLVLSLRTTVLAEENSALTGNGETKTFSTKAEADAWKTEVEAEYKAKNESNDGYLYTVTWSEITAVTSDTEKEPVGSAEVSTFGPYGTQEEAEAAISKARAEDPSADLHEVKFSDIKSTVVSKGESQTACFESGEYDTEEARNQAITEKEAELEKAGYTITKTTPTQSSGTVTGVSLTSQSKNDYAAKEYTVPAGSYIVVKQATSYIIWTPTNLSQYKDTFQAYVNSQDSSTDGKTFDGMTTGFDTVFHVSKNTDDYSVHDNGDGTYTLKVPNERISHMDYGSYTTISSGGKYSFTIDYTIPAETGTTYSFTKTVQEYRWKTVYTLSYSMSKTPTTSTNTGDKNTSSTNTSNKNTSSTNTRTINTGSTSTNSVQTGDNSNHILWIMLLTISAAGLIGTFVVGKKRLISK